MANKLLSNIDILKAVSSNLTSRFSQQQQELEERQKKIAQRQQEQNKHMDHKISLMQTLKSTIKNE